MRINNKNEKQCPTFLITRQMQTLYLGLYGVFAGARQISSEEMQKFNEDCRKRIEIVDEKLQYFDEVLSQADLQLENSRQQTKYLQKQVVELSQMR